MTWENPLAPSSSSTPAASASATPGPSVPRPAGGLPDIDPELAYLLPSEARDAAGNQLLAVSGRFQQRDDGAFAARDEYERQKRFGDAYFDVEGWERERGKRRKEEEPRKVTKKDMVSPPSGQRKLRARRSVYERATAARSPARSACSNADTPGKVQGQKGREDAARARVVVRLDMLLLLLYADAVDRR